MKIYLSLGSNLGDKKKYLETAIFKLKKLSKHISYVRHSPLFETPPLLPVGSPESWNRLFLNTVIEMKQNKGKSKSSEVYSFLRKIKNLEKELKRTQSKRGAPRTIDIDILYWEGIEISTPELTIPHKNLKTRSFFLDPLKHLEPKLSLFSKKDFSVLFFSRKKKSHLPLWMGIINITPDSFSDGGKINRLNAFENHLEKLENDNITPQILDFGAESTRPCASSIDLKEEWKRLSPFLKFMKEKYKNETFKPLISVDTQNAKTAKKALELGVNWINDVSGLQDKNMISVLQAFPSSKYVLMHSLGAPVKKDKHLPLKTDPIKTLKNWALEKMYQLEKEGIDRNRIIFDPGIGFGKTALQSIEILRRIKEFHDLPLRLLVGPSRKSFMNSLTSKKFSKRDTETLGISLWLSNQGVDIIRVHDIPQHIRAFRAWSYMDLKPLHLV